MSSNFNYRLIQNKNILRLRHTKTALASLSMSLWIGHQKERSQKKERVTIVQY